MKDKVVKAARELGLQVDVKTLARPPRTGSGAASAVGCDEAQIAKTLVFVADGDPVLVVASGAHRVDPDLLADVFDVAEIRQATPEEVRAAPGGVGVAAGFPIGGVSPLGCPLPIAFDETLLDYDCVFAAGGDGNTLFQVNPRTLADALHARIVQVAESPPRAA